MEPIRLAGNDDRKLPKRLTLTQKCIAEIPIPIKNHTLVYDTRQTGLCVLVTPAGHKTFYVYKWFNGRPRKFKLGTCQEITIDQARRAAAEAVAKYAQGVDPEAERRSAREETTLGDVWNDWLEKWAKPRKRTWKQDICRWEARLKKYQNRRLSEFDTGYLAGIHTRVGKDTPYEANRLMALLSTLFSYAASNMGYTGINPCRAVRRFPEVSRERFIQPSELPGFFAALEATPDPMLKDFFWLLLLTGARRSNVQAMQWSDINLADGVWTIQAKNSKNKKTMTIYLSADAITVLKRRRNMVSEDVPWVFPSFGEAGHLVEPKKAWAALLERAGIENLHLHDLRRTLGSWQAAIGASTSIIGRSLGHQSPAATAIYSRLNLDPVRRSVDAATAEMMKYKMGK